MRIRETTYRGTFCEPPYEQTPFAVATPAIEARRTSDKIRAEIVGKENWHARGGGEQVAFKQFLPDVDRPRGVEVDRQLPTNITDPPSVINVNHIRAKNYGGNNTGGPTYTPATLEGNWFEIRYEPAKYAPLAAKQVVRSTYAELCAGRLAEQNHKPKVHPLKPKPVTWLEYERGKNENMYETTTSSIGTGVRKDAFGRTLPAADLRPRTAPLPVNLTRMRVRQTSYDCDYVPQINPECPRAIASHIGPVWH